MNDDTASLADRRVLFLAPTSRDGSTTQALMATIGIPLELCRTFKNLVDELQQGASAILLPEEAVGAAHSEMLRERLAKQPPWSDLPILVLARQGADSADVGQALQTMGNVTLLERPVRVATLLSAVRTAVRARERQYQIRGHLVDRAQAEESLRLADRRKDEFIATLGHELRNPLAPLLTGLQLLQQAGSNDPVVTRVSGVMERQVIHLNRLVNDLLEVSRITRGVIDVQFEALDLGSVLQSAIDTSLPSLTAGHHELTVTLPDHPIAVSGDAVRLTQVFGNLLTNAAKYTDAGGHVWLTVRQDGSRAIVSVRDDGIGIPPAHLTSVFEMFAQVDRSADRTQGGLGIGLTLVRSLVAIHGGYVEARSAGLGAGSEFVVELPVLADRPLARQHAEVARPFVNRRVLLVDDNRDAGELLGALLGALGATVRVARSGREALAAVDPFAPDAIVLDIGMPDMDGYEVSRRIRAMPGHRTVLLIALTGWGQDDDRQRSRAAGFDHHLVKPVDIDQLGMLLTAGAAAQPPRQ